MGILKKVGVAGFEPLPFSRGSSLINKFFTVFVLHSPNRLQVYLSVVAQDVGDYYYYYYYYYGDVCQTCGYPRS